MARTFQAALLDVAAGSHANPACEDAREVARSFFHAAYDEAWSAAKTHGKLEQSQKARCQLASSNVVLAAAEAVDLVHSCVGTAGIRSEQRFEKHFRDVHVIAQHAFVCETRLEAVGQIMLGLEPDWGFFAL